MPCRIHPEAIEDVIEFHGHSCPGLAIGIRAAEMALLRFGPTDDEDLVALSESDICAVDAVQYLTGCTLGKGNLIIRDFGKIAFTFFNRQTGEGFRALLKHDLCGDLKQKTDALRQKMERDGATHEDEHQMWHLRDDLRRAYLNMDLEELFDVQPPQMDMPRDAHILASLPCAECGEYVMESKTRRLGGKTLCIPCFRSQDQKG